MTYQIKENMMTNLTAQIWNDPALLSVWILDRHADKISSGQGWSAMGYSQFLQVCKQLAKMTGEDLDVTVNHIVSTAKE
jgi:hypothetical protein